MTKALLQEPLRQGRSDLHQLSDDQVRNTTRGTTNSSRPNASRPRSSRLKVFEGCMPFEEMARARPGDPALRSDEAGRTGNRA
ncbi:MAG: hypothetical protein M0C28_18775 [Candidatus Moduliflexus flocculans]|nr:hypothetical protein [Candidatus Moduliflexus flocculans]